MPLKFDWYPAKDQANQRAHKVSFEEASTVFGDVNALLDYDDKHSIDEDRWLLVGLSNRDRILLVVFSDEDGIIRIITAWRATKRERNAYETAYQA